MDRVWRHPSELPAFDDPPGGRIRHLAPVRARSILAPLGAGAVGAAGSLHLGATVYAVGADSAGTPWVSEGIVSSLGGRVASDGTTMSGLIESNALAEPAIAGGALLDAEGRVAGILMTPVGG